MSSKLPTANDVILGRGGRSNRHEGNRKFRQEVNNRKKDYAAAVKREKAAIAEEIVKSLRSKGVRFLKQIEQGNDSSWEDVGDAVAKQKTSQALRENPEKEAQRKRQRLETSTIGNSISQSNQDAKACTPKIANATPDRYSHTMPEREYNAADRQNIHARMDKTSHYLTTNIHPDSAQFPPLPPSPYYPHHPQQFYNPYHHVQRHHAPEGYFNTPISQQIPRIDPNHHPYHNRAISRYPNNQLAPPRYFQGQAQTPQPETPQLDRPTNLSGEQTKMGYSAKTQGHVSSDKQIPSFHYDQPTNLGMDRRMNNSLDSEDLPMGSIDLADFSNLFDPDNKEEGDDSNQASVKRESEPVWNQIGNNSSGGEHGKPNTMRGHPSSYKKEN